MHLTLLLDCVLQNNPGAAGAGVVIRDCDGRELRAGAHYLGQQTAETAQYRALLHGLDLLAELKLQSLSIEVRGDFLVQHLTSQILVANPAIEMLHEQAQFKLLRMPRWSIRVVAEPPSTRCAELAQRALETQETTVFNGPSGLPSNSAANPSAPELPPRARHPAAPQFPPSATPTDDETRDVPGGRAVHVQMTSAPRGECPAGDWCPTVLTVAAALPVGVCVQAAHALLPTILAMQNTKPGEFPAIPTLTVRCSSPTCPAVFHLSPAKGLP